MRPLLSLLIACRVPAEMPELSSYEFTETELAAIPEEAAAWNEVTLPRRHITCLGRWCTIGAERWTIRKEEPCCWPSTGSTYYVHRIISVVRGLDDVTWRATVRHEFGHAIGIHEHTPDGVMHWNVPTLEITPAVLEACREAEACP
jgi:hypothetical protein